jgi:hypothetical protein
MKNNIYHVIFVCSNYVTHREKLRACVSNLNVLWPVPFHAFAQHKPSWLALLNFLAATKRLKLQLWPFSSSYFLNWNFSVALAFLMHHSKHQLLRVWSICYVSAVPFRVTPSGCSGRLNRTVAVTDVRDFVGLADSGQPRKKSDHPVSQSRSDRSFLL